MDTLPLMTPEQAQQAQRLKEEAQQMTMEEIDKAVKDKELSADDASTMRAQLRARETRARLVVANARAAEFEKKSPFAKQIAT